MTLSDPRGHIHGTRVHHDMAMAGCTSIQEHAASKVAPGTRAEGSGVHCGGFFSLRLVLAESRDGNKTVMCLRWWVVCRCIKRQGAGAHDVNVAMESRKRVAAPARSRVASRKVASYTLSRFLRSQSPPFSHSSAAAFSPAFTACQSPTAMSSLHHSSASQQVVSI